MASSISSSTSSYISLNQSQAVAEFDVTRSKTTATPPATDFANEGRDDVRNENNLKLHNYETLGKRESGIAEADNIPHKDGEPTFVGVRLEITRGEDGENAVVCKDMDSKDIIDLSVDEYEVKWVNGDKDPENPRAMSKCRKWIATCVISGCSLCVTCVSSIYSSTYAQITRDFNVSTFIAVLGLSLFILGLGIGPMVLSPLSEFYGRRPIFLWSFISFFLLVIPCAVAKNIETMLVGRFLNGLSGSAFLSVAGGTVGDMFSGKELGLPMVFFAASPFIGPELGPVIGNFINQRTTWRWTYYTVLIWSFVMIILIYFFVPETYHPVLLRHRAMHLREATGNKSYYAPIERNKRSIPQTIALSILRPFQLLIFEPIVACLSLTTAILLGILFIFFESFPIVFGKNGVYGFDLEITGLMFLGLPIGMVFAVFSDPIWKKIYMHLQRSAASKSTSTSELSHPNYRNTSRDAETAVIKEEQVLQSPPLSIPEHRLPPTVVGTVLATISLFIFAFTARHSVSFIIPVIASSFFGFGILLSFTGVYTYIIDAYPLYAASAMAANSFVRSLFAAGFPLFSYKLYDALGIAWGGAVLGFLCLIMIPFTWGIFSWGHVIRRYSRFSSRV